MSAENIHRYTTGDIHDQVVEVHVNPKGTKSIWLTFWILLFITMFEVGIAFTSINRQVLKWTFISLTLVKAYFIVFSFMHLGHERKFFKFTILLPFMFILYFIIMALYEANAVGALTDFFAKF